MSQADFETCYYGSMALRDRLNAIEPDDPVVAGMSVAGWLDLQLDPPAAKAAFRSQADRVAAEFDLIRRDDFEALRAEVAALRAEVEALRATQAPASIAPDVP